MFNTGRLGDLIRNHIGGGTPSRGVAAFWKGNIPWASVKDFEDGVTELSITEETISDKGLNASSSNLIPAGNLIICSRMAVGRAAFCLNDTAINQDLKAIFPHDGVDVRYLLHLINWLRPIIESRSLGSTVKGIRIADLLAIESPIAPQLEQPFIAKIIDNVNIQIRETETIINKLQQVKQGLLHDLLTRGVDENGELRPSYQDAPELYKPSELGWIPKSWDVEYLSDLSESGLMNGVFKEPSRVGKGIPLVNVADLYKGEEVSINTCELFDATEIEKERYDVKRGDIFFTRSSLKLGGIAHTSFINCDCESVVFECHVMRLRPNLKKVIPLFLKEWCVGVFARKHFMANAKQVTMTTISQDGIRNLPCPKPIIEEQYLIEKVICGFEGRVTNEISSLKKLKAEKSGLMDDLLTGKKRVTDLLKQQAS